MEPQNEGESQIQEQELDEEIQERSSLLQDEQLSDTHSAPPSFTELKNDNSNNITPNPSLQLSDLSSSPSSTLHTATKVKSKWLLLAKVLLTLTTLLCLVASKVSLLEIGGRLYSLTNFSEFQPGIPDSEIPRVAVTIYWELLFILWIPNAVTIVRCLWNGMYLETKNTWPTSLLGFVIYIAIVSVNTL